MLSNASRNRTWASAAAVLLLGAAASGCTSPDAGLTDAEAAAVEVIEAFTDAMNGDNIDAVAQTLTDDFVWVAVGGGETGTPGPFRGEAALFFLETLLPFAMTPIGDPIVLDDDGVGDLQVTLPVELEAESQELVNVHILEMVDGEPKIAELYAILANP
jgi:hypothetical protein